MVWLVGALLLLWLAWGPIVLLVAAALLCVPRVRWWVQDRRFEPRETGIVGAGVAVVVAGVLAVPDGWLPIPPAPGAWAVPAYVGRPATAAPIATEVAQNPHLVAGAPASRPGPLGLQPEIDTAWLGGQRCGELAPTSDGRLVARCADADGSRLRLVDPETMRTTDSHDLGAGTGDPACSVDAFYLDDRDRAVVATGRAVAVVGTGSGEDGIELATTWDLKPWIPFGDCVVGIAPDWSGLVWWVSRAGLLGTVEPVSERVAVIDLAEPVRHGLAVDQGGAYVVSEDALRRVRARPDGTPEVLWRTEHTGRSGSAPVLVDGGVVAVTDEQDDQLGVVFVARDTGADLCRQPVFEKDQGATDSTLASLGRGVVVVNNHGYTSPRSTLLGFTSDPGIARVDLADTGCVVRWTSEVVSPGSGATASWPNGLVYAWTKRPSLAGVSAWYLTALDAGSGRTMWSARTGTGLMAGSDGSRITLAPDGSAWLGTLAGLVRVRDRSPG